MHRTKRVFTALCGMALCLVIACASTGTAPKAGKAPASDPRQAWADVLSKYVDTDGRIDFRALASNRGGLDLYVGWVGRVSPRNSAASAVTAAPAEFPSRDSKLAYYINAYNALAMHTVLELRQPKDLATVKDRLFGADSLVLGGERISLGELENRILRPMGDPRIHFALNDMARSSPRLPREPFRADQLDMELEATAQFFLNQERNVQVDASRKTVRLSSMLELYAEDFLRKAPSLIAYANRYRDSKIPDDYRVEFIPFDWTLNQK